MLQVSRRSSTGQDPRRVGAVRCETPIKGIMTLQKRPERCPVLNTASDTPVRCGQAPAASPAGEVLHRHSLAPAPLRRSEVADMRWADGDLSDADNAVRSPCAARRTTRSGAGPTVRRAPRRRLRDRGQTACPPRPRRPTHGFGHRPRRPTRSKTALRLRRGPTSRAAGPRTAAASTRGFSRPTSKMCICGYGRIHK